MEYIYLPFAWRTVAYRLFARGQDCLLHRPETLYSFLQKAPVFVLEISAVNINGFLAVIVVLT